MTRAHASGKLVVALFVGLVYYSYLLAPDWMFNYFTRASDVPLWMVVYILILYFFAYSAGFMLKFELAKVGKWCPIVAGIVLLAACIIIPVAMGTRYTMVGTLEQFQSGQVASRDTALATPFPWNYKVGVAPGLHIERNGATAREGSQAIPLPQSAVGKLPGTLTLLLVPISLGLLYWSRRQKF